ncbi:hypothetical protein HXX76_002424 [Chlamydomonas incerta]|uniref:Maltase n=1 Tax=Chlamydomonas incerta TaxID=51695 RepID=A0A835TF98_CHLIN|nr:hypothetical protein HXX76_002424 [Chlamydomonas incerta]|eukprot:KAG2442338.1 hypothetical protein HXX76_002424 [Chlamydomonas incerta]
MPMHRCASRLVLLLLFLYHGASAGNGPSAAGCSPEGLRSDCGYYGIQQTECEQRGCCWSPTHSSAGRAATGAARGTGHGASHGGAGSRHGNDIPWCFHPNAVQTVYTVQSVEKVDPGGTGAVTRMLLQLHPGPAAVPELGPDFEMLQVELQQQTPHRLYLRVTPMQSPAEEGAGAGGAAGEPQQQERWRVPEQLLPRPPLPTALPEAALYQLQLPQPGDDFSLCVTRRPTPADRQAAHEAKHSAAAHADASAARRLTANVGDRSEQVLHPYQRAGQVASQAEAEAEAAAEAEAGAEADSEAEVEVQAAGEPLLEVLGGGCLVFKPQYLQLRLRVPPETNLYGMGEVTLPDGLRLRRDGAPRALWNSDTPAAAVGVNLYGSHPVLYGITPGAGGSAWGLFLANSNAMEFAAGSEDVTFRLTGGELELWLFSGPTPEAVSRQYLQVVGAPALPPRWALGFHQSRYGYADVGELEAVVAGFEGAGLPLEALWSDIDLYDRDRMFVTDPARYPEERLRALVDRLHAGARRWVPIVDCGITALPGQAYAPYERGLAAGVFLRDSGRQQPLLGQVWSGPTHWPDFMHPNASEYWGGLLSDMAARLPFDGLWLDMNEPSNFCTGQCRLRPSGRAQGGEGEGGAADDGGGADLPKVAEARRRAMQSALEEGGRDARRRRLGISCDLDCTAPSPDDPLSYPPYAVNNGNRRAPLYVNTLPMNAVGYGGVLQYDAHNLYALAEAAVTHGALRAILPGSRPFILTRRVGAALTSEAAALSLVYCSTWAGSGRYAAHWSGDNGASWADLARGGGSLLAASLAGIAAAGADVCGFWGATSEQLCARWLAAGCFYTFTRDHSDHSPQEPFRFPAAAQAARNSLRARYALLPYLYTALYGVHTGRAGTVARPLAWEFPADPRVADLSTQWLLGDSLLVAPVLQPDTDWVAVLFPAGARSTWCRLGDLGDCHTGPAQHLVQSPLGSEPPLFLRAGAIIPTQPLRPAATTTAEVAASPLALTALLSPASELSGGRASGGGGGGGSRGGGGTGVAWRDGEVDWAAAGLLYSDNGTDPRVDGPGCLRAALRAGALLAAGTGYLAYEVQLAPPAAPAGGGGSRSGGASGRSGGSYGSERNQGGGGSSGGGGGGGAAGAGPAAGGADTDVRLLRVAEVAVVGVALPAGADGFEVEVEVEFGGQAHVQVPRGAGVLQPEQLAAALLSAEQPGERSQQQRRAPRRLAERAAAEGTAASTRGVDVAGVGDKGVRVPQEGARRSRRSQAHATVGVGVPVPATAVQYDSVSQVLRVRGLELSAVASFRLVWKPRLANPSSAAAPKGSSTQAT